MRGGPARQAWDWVVCALGAALLAVPCAQAAPELGLTAGTTFHVNGEPGSGGVSTSAALLWPFEDRYAFGVVLYADDQGSGMTELFDPNTGQSLGTVGDLHRWTYGVSWRGEARLTDSRKWRVMWGADFGYARQEADVRGEVTDATSDVLVATGPTLLWKMVGGQTLGLSGAWKHAFVSREESPDRTTDWASLALTWRWQRVPRQ
jgi:hypothetical protein